MIQKNKRHMHFLWICKKVGQEPAEFANDVRRLRLDDMIDMGIHKVGLSMTKNTPDGRLYMLDLYEDDKLIRRSPCFIDPPKRGRNVRMVTAMAGELLLVGMIATGVGVAYLFGSGLADDLITQSSCEILRFDVFDVDEKNVYYVVEAQNSSTHEGEFSMSLMAETGEMHDNLDGENLAEFESYSWSSTAQFTGPLDPKSDYLVEVTSTNIGSGDIICTAKTVSK